MHVDADNRVLNEDAHARQCALLQTINQRNFGYFEQELLKKLGLEQEIKSIDVEIKDVRRLAATSPTLEGKLSWQKKQRELEARRGKLRRDLFARQDEVKAQHNDLITQLEGQQQQVEEYTLFTIEWELK
ncbi:MULTISPECIES: hypothetical protein [Acidithiobacillus]|uniref:Uncharacterized protein n=2 Tax=Acidithiobacillus TaxID=119977 RepID=A0A179B6J7_ACIFR|nr:MULTISPECIES: hypothetical protein [Acidithiobacillus]MDA8182671.1 hypothetical protein [Acidithiobacillus sp.]MEB8486795.1 hypothetical protein [Acidithiobacillus ferriphilus]MEB8490972.1 hypothetical protein [Acidithiobacillus ferriphilus]MEB8493847.1 hypothetical protein [Acidithiobacillus ferriphilus]MEB8514256.1 hypothetical protein [Acidithiobacillus ferriphilus]